MANDDYLFMFDIEDYYLFEDFPKWFAETISTPEEAGETYADFEAVMKLWCSDPENKCEWRDEGVYDMDWLLDEED